MREFYEFEEYLAEHVQEIVYDTARAIDVEKYPDRTLTQQDLSIITELSMKNCLALLRAYYHWTEDDL